jgi:hypothetical protein
MGVVYTIFSEEEKLGGSLSSAVRDFCHEHLHLAHTCPGGRCQGVQVLREFSRMGKEKFASIRETCPELVEGFAAGFRICSQWGDYQKLPID